MAPSLEIDGVSAAKTLPPVTEAAARGQAIEIVGLQRPDIHRPSGVKRLAPAGVLVHRRKVDKVARAEGGIAQRESAEAGGPPADHIAVLVDGGRVRRLAATIRRSTGNLERLGKVGQVEGEVTLPIILRGPGAVISRPVELVEILGFLIGQAHSFGEEVVVDSLAANTPNRRGADPQLPIVDDRPFQAEALAVNLVGCRDLPVSGVELVDSHVLGTDIDRLRRGRQAALDDAAELFGSPDDLSIGSVYGVDKAAVIGDVDAIAGCARSS
jgi:hypothetical protein